MDAPIRRIDTDCSEEITGAPVGGSQSQSRPGVRRTIVWSGVGDEDTTERFSCGLYRVVTGRVSDSRVQFFIS